MSTAYHARYFAYELTRKRPSADEERLSMSLFDACVDLNPHQIEAAMFALKSPLIKGVILADEVGLGKTIEAGLVLCQYWAERRRQLLIICPAAIRKQWSLELEEKNGDRGGSAHMQKKHKEEKRKTDLTLTGLLMEGLVLRRDIFQGFP
jgi:SNF2 family DNA or RNA helicase